MLKCFSDSEKSAVPKALSKTMNFSWNYSQHDFQTVSFFTDVTKLLDNLRRYKIC